MPDVDHIHFFEHECENPTCDKIVQYDDEPCCFEHSPDSGSSVTGYSARAKFEKRNGLTDENIVDEQKLNDLKADALHEHRTGY